jgi:tRNA(Ile)-lysidine synthase
LSGLGGISPVEDNIIRPLVETRRKDILDYLEKNNIEYCIDRTNLDNRYERNKVRNLLVPFIKNNFSDSFDERLLKTIEIIREEDIFISAYANTGLKEIAQFNMDESGQTLQSIQIPIEKLNRHPDDLKKRIFIEAIKELKGSVEDIKSLNLEDLLVHCCSGGEKKEITLSGGLSFLKESDKLHFLFKDNSLIKDPGQWRHKINIGTKQVFKKQGVKILSRSIEGGLEKIDKEDVSESEAYMDFDKIILPVYIRNWQKDTGERFYPLGIKNSKKLHDFFIDEKIPYSKRRFLPVFTDSEKILWIGKLRLDERVKLDKNTKKILYIKIFDV